MLLRKCHFPGIHRHFFGLSFCNMLGESFRPICVHFMNWDMNRGSKYRGGRLIFSECNDLICKLLLPDTTTVPLRSPSASVSSWIDVQTLQTVSWNVRLDAIETQRPEDFANSIWDQIEFNKVQSASSTPLLDFLPKMKSWAVWLWTFFLLGLADINDFMVIQWNYKKNKVFRIAFIIKED